MEVPQIYAMAAGGLVLALLTVQLSEHTIRVCNIITGWTSKYLTFPNLLDQQQLAGPWSPGNVLVQIFFISYVSPLALKVSQRLDIVLVTCPLSSYLIGVGSFYSEDPHSHRPNSHNGLPDSTNKLHSNNDVSHTRPFHTSRTW